MTCEPQSNTFSYNPQNIWYSLSVQVIQRGTRSAGYGFVSVKDIAQVEKAVAELHKKDLDGRSIIVEAAKPAEDKERERNPKRTGRRAAGRRGNKAPPGEVTEAEANGEVPESVPEAAASEDKPKKRTKKPVSLLIGSFDNGLSTRSKFFGTFVAQAQGQEDACRRTQHYRRPC